MIILSYPWNEPYYARISWPARKEKEVQGNKAYN